LPAPFDELQVVSRALSWKGVNFAAAALLGPPPFTRAYENEHLDANNEYESELIKRRAKLFGLEDDEA
jgi:hypothetical protein